MFKRYVLIAALLIVAQVYARGAGRTIVIPVDSRTNPTDARQMYTSYCAPCHGADGRGHGLIAGSLKTPPPDLTMLARAHGGKYPDSHVVTVLSFGTETNTAVMPAWGPVFARLESVQADESTLRINNLTRYLKTIQVK